MQVCDLLIIYFICTICFSGIQDTNQAAELQKAKAIKEENIPLAIQEENEVQQ